MALLSAQPLASPLGRDDDDAPCASRAVDGGAGVLQYVDPGDVARANAGEHAADRTTRDRDAVDHEEWFVVPQAAWTAEPQGIVPVRQPANLQAGNAALQQVSKTVTVLDLVDNAAELVKGIGLNGNGTLGVARGQSTAYFFSPDLRLLGEFAVSEGGAGAALHPDHDTRTASNAGTLAFVGTGEKGGGIVAAAVGLVVRHQRLDAGQGDGAEHGEQELKEVGDDDAPEPGARGIEAGETEAGAGSKGRTRRLLTIV